MSFETNYLAKMKKLYPYVDWDLLYTEFGFVAVIKVEEQLKNISFT